MKSEAPDPRVVLGNAITQAEATDGKLTFAVERGGTRQEVAITIPVLGGQGTGHARRLRNAQRQRATLRVEEDR